MTKNLITKVLLDIRVLDRSLRLSVIESELRTAEKKFDSISLLGKVEFFIYSKWRYLDIFKFQ